MKMRKCMSAIFMVESQGNALYLRLQNFIVTKATINLNLKGVKNYVKER